MHKQLPVNSLSSLSVLCMFTAEVSVFPEQLKKSHFCEVTLVSTLFYLCVVNIGHLCEMFILNNFIFLLEPLKIYGKFLILFMLNKHIWGNCSTGAMFLQ